MPPTIVSTPGSAPTTPDLSHPVPIDKLVAGGMGLARMGQEIVFVPGGLPEEVVRLDGVGVIKGVRHGRIRDLLKVSAERVSPPCPQFGRCGGCQLQHLSYEGQLYHKREILTETLARIGKVLDVEVAPMVPSPRRVGYRTTIRFTVFREAGRLRLGLYRAGSHEPVMAQDCLLMPEEVRSIVTAVADGLGRQDRIPVFLESLELRWSPFEKRALAVFRGIWKRHHQGSAFLATFQEIPGVAGWILCPSKDRGGRGKIARVVSGQEFLLQQFHGLTLHVSYQTFQQANWPVFEAVGERVWSWIGEAHGLRVLELFAGTGALSMELARRGAQVTLVEGQASGLTDGRQSALLSGVRHCRFRRASVEGFLPHVRGGDYDVVILDPPRTGLSPTVTAELGRIRSPRLLYLSCDAATLARDLGRLRTSGYRVRRIQPFDMFPQTAHIETLVELAA